MSDFLILLFYFSSAIVISNCLCLFKYTHDTFVWYLSQKCCWINTRSDILLLCAMRHIKRFWIALKRCLRVLAVERRKGLSVSEFFCLLSTNEILSQLFHSICPYPVSSFAVPAMSFTHFCLYFSSLCLFCSSYIFVAVFIPRQDFLVAERMCQHCTV